MKTISTLCITALVAGGPLWSGAWAPGEGAGGTGEAVETANVVPVSLEGFQQILEQHRGSVVVVNLWATWCIPCVQELPDLELLQQRYAERGLVVLPVSLDDPSRPLDQVATFLGERAPDLVSYLQTEDDEYVFVTALDEEWFGVLPTTFFYDRAGDRVETHSGRLLYKDFEKRVLPLLAPR